MATEQGRPSRLEWTGERYLPEIGGNIRLEHMHRYLLARELARDRRVLDIACGEGYGSDLLASVGSHVVGVDISPEVIRHATRGYRRANLGFAVGTCAAIPLTDQSVDLVVSFETIEHHDQHEEMIREVKRVLRPGGLLIISSPDRRQYSDLSNYQNPFHVRELYREEFEGLIGSHFRHVVIVGQRVRAGSLIEPMDKPGLDRLARYDATGESHQRPEARDPLYLIAVASDRQLPKVPVGFLEGTDFMWSEDYARACQSQENEHRAHVAQLMHAQAQTEGATAVLRSQLELQITRMCDMSAAEARAQAELNERNRQYAELDQARHQLQRLVNDVHVELESVRARLNEACARVESQAQTLAANSATIRSQIATIASLEEVQAAARGRVEQLEADYAASRLALEQLEADYAASRLALEGTIKLGEEKIQRLEQKIQIVENSRSWYLTAPLRASRRLVGGTASRVRAAISNAARATYRRSPISIESRLRLKGAIFRTAPFLVRHTAAYRAWQLHRRAQAALARRHSDEESAAEFVPLSTHAASESRIKAIAFYLPQFHPIPENDRWWGKGFTEWQNVSRAKPQFPGHYQPHLPGELGFYDLRILDVQRRQIELARQYGLHGFCYHHYWFGGTRLLRRPLDQLLANPDLDFPFCLCWANENWTRRWDGLEEEILIAQQHSPEDDLAFIRDIEPALRDPRYIRVGNRPLLVVYRPALLPDARATAARWRTWCREAGIGDLFLVSTHAFDRNPPSDLGFDAALEFAPNNMGVPAITSQVPHVNAEFRGTIYDYRYLVEYSRRYEPAADYQMFRGVAPMWDNEARRPGRGGVFAHSSPAVYGQWLENACRYTDEQLPADRRFVFINAWNEWAEGAHLEPDRRHGYAYLQATADALSRFPLHRSRPLVVIVSHDAYYHGAQLIALTLARTLANPLGYDVETVLCGDGPLKSAFEQVGPIHDFHAHATTRDARVHIIQDLHARGARVAFCNTSVVGDAVELLKAAGFVVVSLVHELPGLIKERGLESSIAKIARHADRVVFPANVVRERFVALTGLAPDRTVVRPQGLLSCNRFAGRRFDARRQVRSLLGLPDSTRIVLAVGYADQRKGIDLFVEVGLQVRRQVDDIVFVWVGNHEAHAFAAAQARIAQAGAESLFRFPGLIDGADEFYAGADAYLMTSREDPFPLVVLHALDAELPVIGFEDGGGFVELLRRDCGILVPYLDTTAMASALERILHDRTERRRLEEAGRAIIDREFSYVDYARDLVALTTPPRPRVSVVVPNYNYATFLPRRLESVLEQTYPPHEIIFLDDGSTDNSVEVAEAVLRGSSIPFRIIRSQSNRGVYPQWLRGLGEASGDLVWIAEADDDCAPTLLETLVPAFQQEQVVLAYCQSKQIDDEGVDIASDYLAWTADVSPTKWRHAYLRRGLDEIRDSLIVKNTIPNVSAVLMRRPELAAIESQLVTMRNAGDWLVYVHLLERGDIAYVPDALNYHRRHRRSITIGGGGLNLMQETLAVQQYVLDRHRIAPETERKRQAALQAAYEHLGLTADR